MSKVRRELARAIEAGNRNAAERCLRKGADPNATDETGIPHLFDAAVRGQSELVKLLLRFGANPHATEPRFGRNALGHLVHLRPLSLSAEQLVPTVRLLISQGLKPDERPVRSEYISPWWGAVAEVSYTPIVRIMLEAGTDPNTPLNEQTKFTPLMCAALNRAEANVHALLEAGADPDAATTAGYTALQLLEGPDPDDPERDNWAPEATEAVARLLRRPPVRRTGG
jgi:ankyrin repeat protein